MKVPLLRLAPSNLFNQPRSPVEVLKVGSFDVVGGVILAPTYVPCTTCLLALVLLLPADDPLILEKVVCYQILPRAWVYR